MPKTYLCELKDPPGTQLLIGAEEFTAWRKANNKGPIWKWKERRRQLEEFSGFPIKLWTLED